MRFRLLAAVAVVFASCGLASAQPKDAGPTMGPSVPAMTARLSKARPAPRGS